MTWEKLYYRERQRGFYAGGNLLKPWTANAKPSPYPSVKRRRAFLHEAQAKCSRKHMLNA